MDPVNAIDGQSRPVGSGSADGEVTDWRVAHAALLMLARRKAGYDAEEARWLVAGKATRVHVGCGYGSYLEYLERTFGYGPRMARERVRVAEALVRLPRTMAALSDGTLKWSAVRELSRVAIPETEAEWVAAAASKTIREVEDMVAGRVLGDRPDDPARPEERTHVLRLELKGPTYAAFRQALEIVTREAGHSLSDDEAMQLICARVLTGSPAAPGESDGDGDGRGDGEREAEARDGSVGGRDPGRASYQIVRGRCVDCERLWQDGGGRAIEIDETTFEVAKCDGQHIGATHVGHAGRATQATPPRTRRQSVRRAHGRCEVPGCRHSGWVDVHHIRFRCDGGTHELDNLAVLCSVHHARVHEGRLLITGRLPVLRFFHADGRPYGSPSASVLADDDRASDRDVRDLQDDLEAGSSDDRKVLMVDAVSALANLGFGTRAATAAVESAAQSLPDGLTFDGLVRAALAHATAAARCREGQPGWSVGWAAV